jgi:hypothetical protein
MWLDSRAFVVEFATVFAAPFVVCPVAESQSHNPPPDREMEPSNPPLVRRFGLLEPIDDAGINPNSV